MLWASVTLCAALAAGDAAPIGRAVLVEGEVTVRSAGADFYAPLPLGATVAVGDALHTGEGRARLLLQNRSVVDLAPDSELVLRSAEGEAAGSHITLRAVLGRLWARVASLDGSERLTLETENAVAGVRGTSLFVDAGPDAAAVTVAEGVIELRPKDGEAFPLAARQRASWAQGAWSVERDLPAAALAEARARVETPRRLPAALRAKVAALKTRGAGKVLGRLAGGGNAEQRRAVLRFVWEHREALGGAGLDIDPAVARRIRDFLQGRR